MPEKLWKKYERIVAQWVGGKRVPITGRQRGDVPDVTSDVYSVECKQRKSVPQWIDDAYDQAEAANKASDKAPLVFIHVTGRAYGDDYMLIKTKHAERLGWIHPRDWPDNER